MAVSAASGHNRSGSVFNGELFADYFQIYVRDRAMLTYLLLIRKRPSPLDW
jgi:hypothetical protein